MLTETDRGILKCLDEFTRFATKDVAERVVITRADKRANSALVRQRLIGLQLDGLVQSFADRKPMSWIRTASGTAALSVGDPEQI